MGANQESPSTVSEEMNNAHPIRFNRVKALTPRIIIRLIEEVNIKLSAK